MVRALSTTAGLNLLVFNLLATSLASRSRNSLSSLLLVLSTNAGSRTLCLLWRLSQLLQPRDTAEFFNSSIIFLFSGYLFLISHFEWSRFWRGRKNIKWLIVRIHTCLFFKYKRYIHRRASMCVCSGPNCWSCGLGAFSSRIPTDGLGFYKSSNAFYEFFQRLFSLLLLLVSQHTLACSHSLWANSLFLRRNWLTKHSLAESESFSWVLT